MEDSPLEQGKLYGSSKAAGGLVASAIANSSDVSFRLLRLFKVYGAGEAPHRLLPALVSGLAKRERVAMSAGTQVLDFVYIDDVVEAMLRADAHCREKGGIATWNVATGRAHSVREFAEQCRASDERGSSLCSASGRSTCARMTSPGWSGRPICFAPNSAGSPRSDLKTAFVPPSRRFARPTLRNSPT